MASQTADSGGWLLQAPAAVLGLAAPLCCVAGALLERARATAAPPDGGFTAEHPAGAACQGPNASCCWLGHRTAPATPSSAINPPHVPPVSSLRRTGCGAAC